MSLIEHIQNWRAYRNQILVGIAIFVSCGLLSAIYHKVAAGFESAEIFHAEIRQAIIWTKIDSADHVLLHSKMDVVDNFLVSQISNNARYDTALNNYNKRITAIEKYFPQ